ncbi:unnamed protein product [Prunus armeniaca]|uniref:Dilute domain-containing protein n=1 Tax=Prunus armeniaca TaxID=36596 RepID=A0A6J5VXE1_PRUAR|nr:unnamed protein product [Prunus armeniaca]
MFEEMQSPKAIWDMYPDQDNNGHMAYWLSNTSTLLFLLQRSLRTAPRKPPTPTSLFGRMTQGFRSSSANLSVGASDVVRQVEAKYPALLFKQQLTAYVEKIYGIVRDNLKKELSLVLSSCIQAPKTSKGSVSKSPEGSNSNSPPANPWNSMIASLNGFLSTLKENCVPPILVQKLSTQTFSYINPSSSSRVLHISNGQYVKNGLAELELWCSLAKERGNDLFLSPYAGSSWDELKYVRQAVGFLVLNQKSRVSYDELTNDLCPFQKDEVQEDDDIPYKYGFFHLTFSLGAMYFAMLFISWNLNNSAKKWSIDVGWTSTWVKIVNEWFAASIFLWTLIYPVLRQSKVMDHEEPVQELDNSAVP